jgi:hypothetical protein
MPDSDMSHPCKLCEHQNHTRPRLMTNASQGHPRPVPHRAPGHRRPPRPLRRQGALDAGGERVLARIRDGASRALLGHDQPHAARVGERLLRELRGCYPVHGGAGSGCHRPAGHAESRRSSRTGSSTNKGVNALATLVQIIMAFVAHCYATKAYHDARVLCTDRS